MNEYLLSITILGAWTVISLICLAIAYRTPSKINPYILDNIPSVFPTLGIMCTAIGISFGLADFDPNNIQGSLPKLISGLKSAFYATIAGIAGLFIFQKLLAVVQIHIDKMPDRPRQASDELTALNQISERLEKLEQTVKGNLQKIGNIVCENSQAGNVHFLELQKVIAGQSEKAETYRRANTDYNNKLLGNGMQLIENSSKLLELQAAHSTAQRNGLIALSGKMDEGNSLLTKKFDEFSELLRKNNTEALVEVMRVSTEQFNAQMSELIDRLVKENFKELNTSVMMLNDWQKENKEQVERLTGQVTTIVTEVSGVTADLKTASNILRTVADLSQELVDDDSKLLKLIKELERVMISDGKFTDIINKVDGSINTLGTTTDAFEETTQKLNVWVRNQMNFNDKAEVIVHQLEEFRNLNGAVWDKYRAEMNKSVQIIAQTSQVLSNDLENINQEFYDRLNDTLQNLDGLIQRFMNSSNRRN